MDYRLYHCESWRVSWKIWWYCQQRVKRCGLLNYQNLSKLHHLSPVAQLPGIYCTGMALLWKCNPDIWTQEEAKTWPKKQWSRRTRLERRTCKIVQKKKRETMDIDQDGNLSSLPPLPSPPWPCVALVMSCPPPSPPLAGRNPPQILVLSRLVSVCISRKYVN